MVIPINNNFSPLPFYDVSDAGVSDELKNKYLNSEKPYAYGAVFDLPIAGGWLMPFQFSVDYKVDHVGSAYVIPLSNTLANTQQLTSQIDTVYDSMTGNTTVLFRGEHHSTLVQGRAYIEIELYPEQSLTPKVYMSDLFNNVFVSVSDSKPIPDGYIRLSYTSDHFLRYNGGKIYLGDANPGFSFDLLIDTTIGKPNYTFEEKSSDRLGYRYIESQVSTKSYSFTFIAPEYLCDAIRLLPMCNQRVIADKWHTYNQITDVNIDVEWLEQGDLARVTITFNNDTVVANLAEYISVAPQRLNTTIPVPPTPEVTLPLVTINSLVGIQQTQAEIESEVVSNGGGTLTERGLCWGTSSTPTISDSHAANPIAQLGQFTTAVTGLVAGTTYYFRAYAINEAGIAYSDSVSLTTQNSSEPPQVTTNAAQDITDVSVGLSGTVTSEGTQQVTSRGIVISSTNQNPTLGGSDVRAYSDSGQGLGSYLVRLSGLTQNTTYYFAAYAISDVATVYGTVLTFKTDSGQSVQA